MVCHKNLAVEKCANEALSSKINSSFEKLIIAFMHSYILEKIDASHMYKEEKW